MSVTRAMKIILAKRSGNRCALPSCRVVLVQDSKPGSAQNIGEAVHISGARSGSARYDPQMAAQERNHVDNLLYLCRNCHAIIDQDVESYSIERLRRIKAEHEANVQARDGHQIRDRGVPRAAGSGRALFFSVSDADRFVS